MFPLASLHASNIVSKAYFIRTLFFFFTAHPSSSLLHTLRSSTALAAETIPSRHLETMGMTLRSASAKLRYVSPSFTVRRSSMSCRFCNGINSKNMVQCWYSKKPLGSKRLFFFFFKGLGFNGGNKLVSQIQCLIGLFFYENNMFTLKMCGIALLKCFHCSALKFCSWAAYSFLLSSAMWVRR